MTNHVHLLLTLSTSENVLWSMKRVNTAADLKGMRIRTLLGPGDALQALGATAVTVPYTDAIDLLQRGGVDAISTTPFEQGVKDGLAEMTNFLSTGGRMGIFATVMTSINLDRWKSFSKPLQDVFTTAADNALTWYIDAQNKETDECVEILMKSKRIQVAPLDPAEEKRWREATSQVIFNKYAEAVKRVGGNPEALKFFDQKNERKHELAMLDAEMRFAQVKGEIAMRQTEAQMQVAEIAAMTEAIKEQSATAQAAGQFVAAISALVRPLITYIFVLLYVSVKVVGYSLAVAQGGDWKELLVASWTEEDMSTMTMLLTFWFTGRIFERSNKRG